MLAHRTAALCLVAFATLTSPPPSDARSLAIDIDIEPLGAFNTSAFQWLTGVPMGDLGPVAPAGAVTRASSSIVALSTGAAIADSDSGALLLVDRDGTVLSRAPVFGATSVAVDRNRHRLYVTDRRNDELVVLTANRSLGAIARWSLPTEPHSVALTPDGKTALVTIIADRKLVGIDTDSGAVRWSKKLPSEPRGIAINADGSEAIVAMPTSGAAAKVDLTGVRALSLIALGEPNAQLDRGITQPAPPALTPQRAPLPGKFVKRKRRPSKRLVGAERRAAATFARGAFAATYLGNGVAVVPYHRSTPVQSNAGRVERRGTYGGGGHADPPIIHRVAYVGKDRLGRAHTSGLLIHAVAHDPIRDRLYLAGKGNDSITVIADASSAAAHADGIVSLIDASGRSGRCGPTGLATSKDGELLVHCGISHRLIRIDVGYKKLAIAHKGEDFGGSMIPAEVRKGRELFFRAGDPQLTSLGAFACASCHPDGRADGLSWRIEGVTLQTPMLTGRMVGTHPFKWDGGDANLTTSLQHTVRRLGGTGIGAPDVASLRAFLEHLEAPRAPAIADHGAVARGRALFDSDETGCRGCHSGDELTDRQRYDLAGDLDAVDTPSLVGLAHSAPYYHDGSAATLEAVLLENGSVHGMGRIGGLDAGERADLIAFLETL